MIKGAGTDLFNQLVPKAHNSECQNILFSVQIKPVKSVKAIIDGFFTGFDLRH